MKHLRLIFRVPAVTLFTILSALAYGIGALLVRLAGYSHLPWRNQLLTFWASATARLIRLEIHTEGSPPEPPFFLVSNHLSYLDIVPLFKNLSCTFIARQDIQSWPLLGRISRLIGVIFIDRTRKLDVARVNRIVSNTLSRHTGIVLFPEGGTSDGSRVHRFRASLLEHPSAIGMPVNFATLHYRTGDGELPASEAVCWHGDISFPAHVLRLLSLDRIICTVTFGKETVAERDRKLLASRLYDQVIKQFTPIQ
ncbi:MAG: lysophospholipid acyltransferase family protein [Balneolaceae bacterium]